MTRAPNQIHYAPESDDVGICGLPGYLVESQEHVTCPWCIDRMRAANVRAGRNADGSARREPKNYSSIRDLSRLDEEQFS